MEVTTVLRLLVCDLQDLSPALMVPPFAGVTVSPVTDEQQIEDYLSVESAVWSCPTEKTGGLLFASLRDPLRLDRGFVAYFERKPVGCGRLSAPQHSRFSGLWGGCVLPDFRGLGVYRALLSSRIAALRQFESIAYLRGDALATSRPILEKYGFHRIASTWPADWLPDR
ncbi:MAG: GNAT family N-acetyltransferase [Verrucomicrobia bacterium]|nr:GNAT family N-acetyltransferase [Verrucomicrobiota bacterium]